MCVCLILLINFTLLQVTQLSHTHVLSMDALLTVIHYIHANITQKGVEADLKFIGKNCCCLK
jgi:hypothetical protein